MLSPQNSTEFSMRKLLVWIFHALAELFFFSLARSKIILYVASLLHNVSEFPQHSLVRSHVTWTFPNYSNFQSKNSLSSSQRYCKLFFSHFAVRSLISESSAIVEVDNIHNPNSVMYSIPLLYANCFLANAHFDSASTTLTPRSLAAFVVLSPSLSRRNCVKVSVMNLMLFFCYWIMD